MGRKEYLEKRQAMLNEAKQFINSGKIDEGNKKNLSVCLDGKLKEFHMINSRFWLFVTLKNKYLMKDFNIF